MGNNYADFWDVGNGMRRGKDFWDAVRLKFHGCLVIPCSGFGSHGMTHLKEGATQTGTCYLGCYCTNLSDSWCFAIWFELFFLKKIELPQYQYLYRSSRNVDSFLSEILPCQRREECNSVISCGSWFFSFFNFFNFN
jgi:hypothetical protein